MGCWNGRNISIKAKSTWIDKNTADEIPHSKSVSEPKSDIDHDTCKDEISLNLDENDFVKAFRTQENHIEGLNSSKDSQWMFKRWHSNQSAHGHEDKRVSEWKKFLIQQLNLDKIKEDNEENNIMNTPPPVIANKPIAPIKVSICEVFGDN